MTSVPKVSRWIRGFDKRTESLAVQHRLSPEFPLERLQELFGIPAHNPMFDVYPIGPTEARVLAPYIDGELELGNYSYYVEADAEE